MKLERAYVRFFRSFNFDYELKAHPKSREREWDRTDLGCISISGWTSIPGSQRWRVPTLANLQRRYDHDTEPLEQVPDYQRFKDQLRALLLQDGSPPKNGPGPRPTATTRSESTPNLTSRAESTIRQRTQYQQLLTGGTDQIAPSLPAAPAGWT